MSKCYALAVDTQKRKLGHMFVVAKSFLWHMNRWISEQRLGYDFDRNLKIL